MSRLVMLAFLAALGLGCAKSEPATPPVDSAQYSQKPADAQTKGPH